MMRSPRHRDVASTIKNQNEARSDFLSHAINRGARFLVSHATFFTLTFLCHYPLCISYYAGPECHLLNSTGSLTEENVLLQDLTPVYCYAGPECHLLNSTGSLTEENVLLQDLTPV